MGALLGLEAGAIAYVGAEVLEPLGPKVSVDRDGYVAYDPDAGSPMIRIGKFDAFIDLERSDLPELAAEVEQLIGAPFGDLVLEHSNGQYDVGRRYGFVLGPTGRGFSALYGHDLERNAPVPGFDFPETRDIIDKILSGSDHENLDGIRTSQLIAQFARDINREAVGADRSDLVRSVHGEIVQPEDIAGPPRAIDSYPIVVEEFLAGEEAYLRPVTGVVIGNVGESVVYALRGKATLGWFATDEQLGYAVVEGYIPAGDTLELVQSAASSSDAEVVRSVATAELEPGT